MKARKNESEKARSFMGVRRNSSRGKGRNFVYHFQIADNQCSLKIILHWTNICFCFGEHDYFRAEQVEISMNYKLCELRIKYTILSKYEQNTHFIQITPCFRWSSITLECCKCARMRFHCAIVLVVLSICAPYREHCWRCSTNWGSEKRFILSTLQRKFPMLR